MSDIGFPALEGVMEAVGAIIALGLPLLIGLLLLLVGRFLRNRNGILTGLYFVLSIGGVFAAMWWYSVWLNDADVLWWALPVAVFSTIFIFSVFRSLQWILARIFAKKLAQKPAME